LTHLPLHGFTLHTCLLPLSSTGVSSPALLTNTSPSSAQVIPLYDNCGGSVPIGKQVDGFVCDDSDPRTVAGDCVLYKDGPKYNLCVMAQRR